MDKAGQDRDERKHYGPAERSFPLEAIAARGDHESSHDERKDAQESNDPEDREDDVEQRLRVRFSIERVGDLHRRRELRHLIAGHPHTDAPVRVCRHGPALLKVEEPIAAIRLLKGERLFQLKRVRIDSESLKRSQSDGQRCRLLQSRPRLLLLLIAVISNHPGDTGVDLDQHLVLLKRCERAHHPGRCLARQCLDAG